MSGQLRNDQRGFTLVELLVALVVTGIITAVIMNFMATSLVQSAKQTAQLNLLQDAQSTLDTVTNDIQLSANADTNNRWADANAPTSGNQYSWQSNGSTLILAAAAQDSSDNIIFLDPLQYITQKNNYVYFVRGGTLYKRILAAPVTGNSAKTTCPAAQATNSCPADKVLAQNVTSFTVSYLDDDNATVAPASARSVQLSIVLATTQYGQKISATYTTRMVFRND